MTTTKHKLTFHDAVPVVAAPEPTRPWEAIAWIEGRWTGDGRIVMVDAVDWEGMLPFPLTVNHAGIMEVIGRVDTLERRPGPSPDERIIVASGVLDLASDLGRDMERLIESRFADGVSMELDAQVDGGIDPDTAEEDMPAGSGGWVMVVESARVRALSVVTTAAFAECRIMFGTVDTGEMPPAIEGPEPMPHDDMPDEDMPDGEDEIVIVAAAGHTIVLPSVPPAEWFMEPTDVTPEGSLTVTDEGRVYGWLAPAHVPYSGVAGNFTAPMGAVNYRNWMRGETIVAGGGRVVTGNITMGCGHGDEHSTDHAAVREHYDNSCSLFARVAAGESSNGVWVAGALYPGVTGEQVERAMGLQCSGHWLPSLSPGFRYDLLAALLVPVPGFGAPRNRPSVTVKDGALAASAVPVRFEQPCGCGEGRLLEAVSVDWDAVNAPVVAALDVIDRRLARIEQANRSGIVAAFRARIGR